jgi:hypothetical protein
VQQQGVERVGGLRVHQDLADILDIVDVQFHVGAELPLLVLLMPRPFVAD